MARTVLRASTAALAIRLQEAMDAGDSLSAGDIRTRLSDALQDQSQGTGQWCYYIDHFGDAESGDVIYSSNGDITRAPYEISQGSGAAKCIIDMDACEDVVPRTVYEIEQDEADHLASMESLRAENLYGEVVPAYERFISKGARDKASASDFAGKGKSFPILKAEDVQAAANSLGRAGSGNFDSATIKSNIIRIAKRKGFALPKAWQKASSAESAEPTPIDMDALLTQLREAGKRHSADDLKLIQAVHDTANTLGAACPDTFRMAGATESAPAAVPGDALKLVESCPFSEDIEIDLREASGADAKKIRLISPGRGSSAWYTTEALKKAASDKIFKAGTPMRIDHPTESEQAARPEGSVKDWGAVLKYDAEWLESYVGKTGKDYGPGLYGEVMPFSDHEKTINEKGPFAGVSICANGAALTEAGKTVMRDGVPVLKEFTSAEGVDMVTRAGARGLFLTESARAAEIKPNQEAGAAMPISEDELKALQESNARLMERAIYQDAVITAGRLLNDVSIPESAKKMVVENVIGVEGAWKFIPRKDGGLDTARFTESINTEAKRVGRMLAEAGVSMGRPFGVGVTAYADAPRPEDIAAREATTKALEREAEDAFTAIMGNSEAAKIAARGRAA